MKLRASTTAALAATLVLIGPASAQAVTGGDLTNSSLSHPGCAYAYAPSAVCVGRNQTTNSTSSPYHNKVTAFSVPSNCDARSQYSPPGTYPYKGGVKYPYSQNDLNLTVVVTCAI